MDLKQVLENTEDDREFIVVFSYGDIFGLTNFEMVDESIYERSDLCVGDVVSIIKCPKKVYRVGNGLQFSIKNVIKVTDATTGDILYQKGVEPTEKTP